jgi:vesicle coat complex subunit
MRHHRISDTSGDLRATDSLIFRASPGATQLYQSEAMIVSVGTRPGEQLVDDPRFRTAAAVVYYESAAGASIEHSALALYEALRRARIDRRPAIVAKAGVLSSQLENLLKFEPLGSNLVATRTDLALIALASRFEETLSVEPSFYVDEVSSTVMQHVESAFRRGFFASVGQRKLSRNQYIYVMSQQHAYVKYTTRILGYCVAYAEESHLRKHFSRHLSEEVNHEKIIESDLAHLGADVEYVVHDLEPNVSTLQFTLGELALVSHFHDSILLTAAPLAAEGLTAHLNPEFIDTLNDVIASWGVANPEKATRFLASHIEFDSGQQGHFEGSMRLLAEYLKTERKTRRYISALHAQMNSFLRIYEDGMDESALWS